MKNKAFWIMTILLIVGIAILIPGKTAHAEGEWYAEYTNVINPADHTILLRKYNGAGGDITVPAYTEISGETYQTVIDGDYGRRPFSLNDSLTSITFSSGVRFPKNCSGMFNYDKNLKAVIFPEDLDTSHVTDMYAMFEGCSALESVNVSVFDTSNVTNFQSMFKSCSSLTSLDVTHFDTSSAVRMSYMFHGCSALESLDVTGFHTENVTYFDGMFIYCSGLSTLDVTSFQTSAAQDMSAMFQSCSGLTELDLSQFDTSSVTNMERMFSGCKNLQSLDLSNFNTENVENMNAMFNTCNNLATLNISSFRTDRVTTMRDMFANMFAMYDLDVTNFNTSNVTTMYEMFSGVRNTTLDISGFDTSNVTDMRSMFSNMKYLETIDLSGFDMSAVTQADNLFSVCNSLVEIKTPGVKPSVSTKILGTTQFAEKDAEGYYKDTRYTNFLDVPASTLIYRVDTYKIAFNANGGSGSMDAVTVQCGVPVQLPANTFTRDGYNFVGWSTTYAAPTTVYEDGEEVKDLTTRNNTYTLYARWKRPVSYSVSVPASISQTVPDGGYFNQLFDIHVSFTGNTGDYLQITPIMSMLSDGKGTYIPMECSLSLGIFRNGGGVGNIWLRSTVPMRDLEPGDYTGTLSITFKSVYG